ncbi:hypothetical protein F5148DRAFT_885651 [Russula earlei]|uniref:Uncharacterized protein n=1 Tax=Russula earlei TaxID=71964 RepID=A0ACC0UBP5_9AGAM|nr:hypothetical protein F5148DRAFT_885651 [Russula earlei]
MIRTMMSDTFIFLTIYFLPCYPWTVRRTLDLFLNKTNDTWATLIPALVSICRWHQRTIAQNLNRFSYSVHFLLSTHAKATRVAILRFTVECISRTCAHISSKTGVRGHFGGIVVLTMLIGDFLQVLHFRNVASTHRNRTLAGSCQSTIVMILSEGQITVESTTCPQFITKLEEADILLPTSCECHFELANSERRMTYGDSHDERRPKKGR